MVRLIVKTGTEREERLFDSRELTLGRSPQSDLVLRDPKTSRLHLRLVQRGGEWYAVDAGSHNGTRVNGMLILRQKLVKGDVISLGDTEIVFEAEGSSSRGIDGPRQDEALVARLIKERSNLMRLQEINRALSSEMNLGPLLERIIDSAIEFTQAERGFLITVREDELELEAARNFKEAEVDQPELAISRSIARKVLDGEGPLIVVNAREDERFRSVQSIANMGLRSVLCVPMMLKGEVIGALYVDNRLDKAVFSEDDLSVLEAFSDQAAIAIQNARQMEELRGKNTELTRARSELEKMNLRLARTVRSQNTELKRAKARLGGPGRGTDGGLHYGGIVGQSAAMRKIFALLEKVIDSDYPVLIHGESGTGKELVASAIHCYGRRSDHPFVTENCAALPDTLLESELFGHVRGAFTGAVSNRKGLLELAHKGTLFLDEVGEMSEALQKKLLRFLQEGEFRPVGGTLPVQVDVRVVSASNRDLMEMVEKKQFRHDLFYRLNVLPIRLPSLSERKEDIPLLIDHFLTLLCEESGIAKPELDPRVIELLCRYGWPGNVRELENEMRRLVTLSSGRITPDLVSGVVQSGTVPGLSFTDAEEIDLITRVESIEKQEILKSLAAAEGNKSRAARKLGISRFTLQRKIDKYGLFPEGK